MSSTETSGLPAEGTATTPAPEAAFPSFGSTRGSGLARGKRPSTAAASATTAAPSDYKPTAIEVVNAPREYTNPFAPAGEPAAAAAPAPAPVVETLPVIETVAAKPVPAPLSAVGSAKAEAPAPAAEEPAELNILPPAEQRSAPAQTWESEGFSPTREPRRERAPREERSEAPADEAVDIDSIPPQFLYVRPGVKFVPTPRNWGGAPRERKPFADQPARTEAPSARAPRTDAAAPAKSGGFLGWLKGLFGSESAPASAPVTAGGKSSGEERREDGHRRHRSGRGGRGGEGGGQRRHRGGRGGRGRSHDGESQGSRQGGSI